MNRYVKTILLRMGVLMACGLSFGAQAGAEPFTKFGDYTVVHSVFGSKFIDESIASQYNLARGNDRALLNLSIVKSDAGGNMRGLPAKVSGVVANLMQQQKALKFIEIREGDAVYYLAPFRIHNEEVLHFSVTVEHDNKAYDLKFTKKLYVD
jgi:Domain of unknown function (DUF4426)